MSPPKPVCLITGSRKGIGRYLAAYYVARSYEVVGCSRTESDLKNANYTHYNLDVADEDAVKSMFIDVRKRFTKLDILINNAGIASMNHSLLTPVSTVKKILHTNVLGSFLLSREAAKLMRKNKYGRIINFSTVAAPLKLEGEVIYASSKAAVLKLTEILAKEFSEFGITVNAIGPTPIDTDLIRAVPKDKLDDLLQKQSIKRFGEMEDVSNVIDFFIRPESSFITGQVLYLGGVS